jgi:hypothetical protein
MSLLSRLFNVFATPGEVFDHVRVASASPMNWIVPILLFVALSWVGAWLMFSQESLQQQFNEYVEKSVQTQIDHGIAKPEDADRMRQASQIGVKIAAYAAPVFLALTQPFWWGLIIWTLGTKFLKGNFGYMKAVEVCGLAGMIAVLEVVVRSLLVIGFSNPFASASLAVLLKNPDPATPQFYLFSIINVLTFWELGVRSVGLSRLSGVSSTKASIWVFGVWVLLQSFCVGLGAARYAAMPK